MEWGGWSVRDEDGGGVGSPFVMRIKMSGESVIDEDGSGMESSLVMRTEVEWRVR